jgi:hypothetical protein
VQDIGSDVVQAVHDYPFYVDFTRAMMELSMKFGGKFENADGLHGDIEFLYPITYSNDRILVVARHGGYVGEDAARCYSPQNDTPDNSVELYSAHFEGDGVRRPGTVQHDIREPESYIHTLPEAGQPAVRAWRGTIAVRSRNIGTGDRENTPVVSLLRAAKRDIRVSPDDGKNWFRAAYVEQYQNRVRPWFTEAEGRRIAAWPITSEYDEIIKYHPGKPSAERFTCIRLTYPDLPFPVAAIPDPARPGKNIYAIADRFWLWMEVGGA